MWIIISLIESIVMGSMSGGSYKSVCVQSLLCL